MAQGNEAEAKDYYARISNDLNFSFDGSDLSGLLKYLGYEGITAADLEAIDPALLTPSNSTEFDNLASAMSDKGTFLSKFTLADFAGGTILSSRFIAPKIVDVTVSPPTTSGWRKLVRLKVRAGSDADKAGLLSGYVLFNYARAQTETDPFKDVATDSARASKNNQVMLVPKPDQASLEDSAYWAVYGTKADGYPSAYFLAAVFDLPSGGAGDGKYFIPRSCATCHGHADVAFGSIEGKPFPFAKVNYLDTDHWRDRTLNGDYFADAGNNAGVLFDGGINQGTPKYERAFDIIRKLNKEIIEQNVQAERDPAQPSFQIRSARKWASLHAASSAHVEPLQRALAGTHVWDSSQTNDKELLGLLNKYCFRCHSSMIYSVFDKTEVVRLKGLILSYVGANFMPQGQNLSRDETADRQKLLDYVNALPNP